ncbi:MAG: twin-arginine translocation signal domain-containing protein, partial [Bacteroidales bacterium]|nr:twin-arginine translocation signal domain-containing protein [Bacteroidales bacterium]MBN2666711.1 twin-arginine translocation signal domain-containing protein [Bacteroidales bacterium]
MILKCKYVKTNRRNFIQNLGIGAAGITLGGTALSTASCASPAAG